MNALGVLCGLPSVLHDAVLCIGRFEHSSSGFNLWSAIYLKIDQSSTLLSVFFIGNSPSRVGSTKVGYDLLFRDLAMTLGIYFHHIRQTVALVKQLKIPKRELSWLTSDQVAELLETIRRTCDNPHVEIITLICLATGARWSEAEKLKPTGLRNAVITFSGTKSGKVRSVPITPGLEARIVRHWKQHGLPNSAITSFRRALAKTTIRLPKGQAAHGLRHTFASHFIQNGGNILTLQKILGHSSLAMTMRYAHLAPDHLLDAVRLGPLASFDSSSTPL
ncbi:Phage integrase family protein [Pseudomonas guineae]|uniref:Phage integrase family protein n=1 Tax=Pseudomonas guineae TaxID=425504 RepID=A0A1I3M599_9PSED|nr:tyrosine-type recombinase/integrase [Pseudomonas guineae]SFI92204.1 Phage integrase family protein [Pseudomonas guineae]